MPTNHRGPDETFAWAKRVPPAWQEELDTLCPGEHVSRLVLVWQAGMPWAPVQRWEIYEVLPASTMARILAHEAIVGISDSLTAGLWGTKVGVRGPDPATIGRWVYDPEIPQADGRKRWRSSSLVSRTQWLLHQQTGGMPYRCWIIEGTQGGHAWNLGQFEKAFLAASGVPLEDIQRLAEAWPDPGSQPYADYDQRTFHALAERNRLQEWRQSLRWDERSGRDVALDLSVKERNARHQAMMQRVLRYIDNQVGDFVSDLPRSVLSQMPKTAREPDYNEDAPGQQLMEE